MKDEYIELKNEFPNIEWSGEPQSKDKNKYYFLIEAYNICPESYNINFLKNYKGIITWSSKFKESHNFQLDIKKIHGFPMFNRNYYLNTFRRYEDKINGICLISRHRDKSNIEGDICHLRIDTLKHIKYSSKKLTAHCYGKAHYGEDMYKGIIGTIDSNETFPSSYKKLSKMNEYRFNLCFENCYHEIWSWDYITEKIFDCFRSKTIAVYWGAYNIERIIPRNLYIDFRDYNNIEELINRLENIGKTEYEDITEAAYEFDKTNKLGSIELLKEQLKELK